MSPIITFKNTLLICCLVAIAACQLFHVALLVAGIWVTPAGLTIWLVYRSVLYPLFFSSLRHIPTVPGAWPFIGHGHILASTEAGISQRRWHAEHGPIIRYFFPFGGERISIADDEAIRLITVKDSYNFVKPEYIQRWMRSILGSGILLVDGADHMRQRKALSPAFSTTAIRELVPVFFSKALQMTNLLTCEAQRYGPAVPIEILEWLNRATLDIIASAGFGYEVNSLQEPTNSLRQAYSSLFAFDVPSRIGMGLRIAFPMSRLIPSRVNRRMANARRIIDDVSADMVNKKMKAENKNLKDVLALVVRQNQQLGRDQTAADDILSFDAIRQQIMTLLAAGHDTTATSVAWTLHLLCKRPDVQKKLREEIRTSMPQLSDPKSMTELPTSTFDVDQLPYLSKVCRESLRFITPIPTTLREALSDVTLCGYHVPKGSWIYIMPTVVNRLIEFWGTDPHPDVFEPDRWDHLPPQYTTTSYLTFLHGPRSCIGRKFAETEMKVLLCCLLSRFRFELNPDFEDQEHHKYWLLVLKPRDGINVKMTSVVDTK